MDFINRDLGISFLIFVYILHPAVVHHIIYKSMGDSDLQEAVTTAVINKRAGGMGLIMGRKAFQKPMKDGIDLLNATQDVYLDKDITVA